MKPVAQFLSTLAIQEDNAAGSNLCSEVVASGLQICEVAKNILLPTQH